MVFLLDSSQGVTNEIYRKEKEFIKSLATNFNISPKGPRGSAIMYADKPYTIASFAEHSFSQRIDSAPLLNKSRRIDKALENAAVILSRSKGRKIVILLTAGKQAKNAKALNEAVEPLRKISAQVFVVSIGQNTDVRQLSFVVDRFRDLFQIPSQRNLLSRSQYIAKEVRRKPGEY